MTRESWVWLAQVLGTVGMFVALVIICIVALSAIAHAL